jgi:hypothetical protein
MFILASLQLQVFQITSAKTASIRLKYRAPLMSNIRVANVPGQIKGQGIGVPSKQARKASVNPTIGLRE